MKKWKPLSLEQRNRYFGLIFIVPWLLGFLMLFFAPLLSSFRYSLSRLEVSNDGYTLEFLGLANYQNALFSHESFVRTLTGSVMDIAVNVPLIVIFSLFTAVLLNQKFRGRGLARAIFFLPVILASGIIASIENGDLMQSVMRSSSSDTSGLSMLQSFELAKMMLESGLSPVIVNYLTDAVDRIYQIISQSGVQILIFLAGLQSIPPSLYEASKIEGATGYEAFWKITFPMISPLILTNVVYTIIDSFINNKTSTLILDTAFKQSFNFGLSAAMSWIYFCVIALILWMTTALISRKVFYNE